MLKLIIGLGCRHTVLKDETVMDCDVSSGAVGLFVFAAGPDVMTTTGCGTRRMMARICSLRGSSCVDCGSSVSLELAVSSAQGVVVYEALL